MSVKYKHMQQEFDPAKPEFGDIVHSNGYARDLNPNGIGSTSNETFLQRLSVDQNRRHVERYNGIKTIASHRRNRMKFERHTNDAAAPDARQAPVADKGATDTPQRTTFREPPSRGYNPYA